MLRKATLLLTSSLTVMAGAVVAPSLPEIAAAFEGASELHVKLILTLPALAIAIAAPVSGFVIDRFGRRPTLLAGLALYALAGSTGLYLDALDAILAGRALLGLAVAGVMTASTTLIGDLFHGDERRSMMSLQASAMAFGGVVFLTGGGLLARLTWRGPFAVYLVALALLPLVFATIREPAVVGHTDAESGTLVPPEGPGSGPGTPWGTIAMNYFTGFVGMALFYLVPVQVPFLLREIADAGGATIGIAIACSNLMGGAVALTYGRVKGRLGFYAIFAIIFAVMGVSYFTLGSAESLPVAIVGLVIAGLGFGWMMPNLNLCLLAAAPPAVRGKLVGGLTATLFLGQFLSPILIHPVADATDLSTAFRWTAAAMLAIALLFVAMALPRRAAGETPAPRRG